MFLLYNLKVLTPYAQETRDLNHKLFERGRGNVCSVEVRNYRSGRLACWLMRLCSLTFCIAGTPLRLRQTNNGLQSQ